MLSVAKRIRWLQIFLILIAGSLFLASPIIAGEDSSSKTAPKAFFPVKNYSFGELFEGPDVKYDFIVENQGDAPLVIKNIEPD